MDILDDMGVSKLSAKVFLKVNYFFQKANRVNWVNVDYTVHFITCNESICVM